ncbi:hypothetical protein PGT21_010474 [Puccinia graminis f. sp. tritici]|uniref:Uncharacterized protein n=1 Tax=Puccinia graminis f. sp. tritici TaxID=56615 RepID=A0A5B0LJ59_PUCGR|nr:hypothetical protein PGT21_010474 [Puccinia graminis f. sp. tritici]
MVIGWARGARVPARGGPEHCRAGRAGLHSRNQQPNPNPFTNRAAHGPPMGSPRADIEKVFRPFNSGTSTRGSGVADGVGTGVHSDLTERQESGPPTTAPARRAAQVDPTFNWVISGQAYTTGAARRFVDRAQKRFSNVAPFRRGQRSHTTRDENRGVLEEQCQSVAITPAPSAPEERLRSRMWTLIGCLPLRASGERRDTGSRRGMTRLVREGNLQRVSRKRSS